MSAENQYIMRDTVERKLWMLCLCNPHQLPSHELHTAVERTERSFTACGKSFQRVTGANGKRYLVNLHTRAVKLL